MIKQDSTSTDSTDGFSEAETVSHLRCECQFCQSQIDRLRRWDRSQRLTFLSLHDPVVAERYPDLTHDQLMEQMYLIDSEGNRHGGAAAFRVLTRLLPRLWILAPSSTSRSRYRCGNGAIDALLNNAIVGTGNRILKPAKTTRVPSTLKNRVGLKVRLCLKRDVEAPKSRQHVVSRRAVSECNKPKRARLKLNALELAIRADRGSLVSRQYQLPSRPLDLDRATTFPNPNEMVRSHHSLAHPPPSRSQFPSADSAVRSLDKMPAPVYENQLGLSKTRARSRATLQSD